jgi:hypothetical protein
MSATSVPREVEEYVAAVRGQLADLPSAERDDLLAEVEASLVDTTEEGLGPIAKRLGPPEEFAAELRAAAGLHQVLPPARPESRLVRRLRDAARRAQAHPRIEAVRRLGQELAPLWWVLRAYLAVGAVAVGLGNDWSSRVPLVPRFGSAELGLVVIGLAVAASVWLGLYLRRRGSPFPRLAAVANMALLLAAVPVAAEVTDTRGHDLLVSLAYAPQPQLPSGLVYDGVPVDNVYPYSRDGRLLHDVLLYDGAGRPLEIGIDRVLDPNRRVVVTNGNRPLLNVFPIRYYEPGTKRVARPNAAPYVELPLVLTPPLPATRDKVTEDRSP